MASVRGRPTKYKKEYIDEAKDLALLGYDNKRLAKHFCVSQSTFDEWITKHESFRGALRDAKERFDNARVEDALFKRAVTGYKVTEVKVEVDHEGRKKTTTTTREIPADTKAQTHWLNNRNPKRWKNKNNIEVEVNNSTLTIQDIYKQTKKTNGSI